MLTAYALLLAAGVVFYELFVRLRLPDTIRPIIHGGREGVRILADPHLSDTVKEAAARRLSGAIMMATLGFVWRLAVVVAGVALLLWIGGLVIGQRFETLIELSLGWSGLLAVLAFVTVYTWARNALR